MSARRVLRLWATLAVGAFLLAGSAVTATSSVAPAADLEKLGRNVDNVQLVDDKGSKIRWSELKGRPRAVFFGFTRCPVICPVTVWEIEAALTKIGAKADRIQVNFVSLDPARDTPAVLKDYFSSFNGRVRGFTGSNKEIVRLANGFEVVHRKVATTGADYTMDHTAAVFLVNEQGKVVDTLAYGTPQDVLIERLSSLAEPK